MGRTKPTVSNEYVVGLTDGEGCFYVNIWKSPAYRAGAAVQLHFHLKMQERDRDLLEMVRNTIGCGAVYFQKEKRANHCQCYRYTVSAKRDILNTLIPFFKRYPLQSASKRANFELFCEIAALVKEQKHLTKEGLEMIRALKQRMNVKTVGLA
ncbi:MAG TPA: LAGLIDADG family homing endonuclease [Candidatus Paceibacterota bacterium]|nr:LAGLIDADG family homing endonuclease [Candidatus Paceibacterota bacterium]